MNLFINDTPVKFIKRDEILDLSLFDNVFLANKVVNLNGLKGNILIDDVEGSQVRQIITQLVEEPFPKVHFVIRPHNYDEAKADFMSLFKVINAAGGVVAKDEHVLMIYRLKKWDFPKGKLDKKETFKHAALREVEEETGLKVSLSHKVCTTWHTYTFRKKRILKCTKWYGMDCLDDKKMAPQKEENIDKVEWLTNREIKKALSDSYNSIRFVWESYLDSKS